MAKKPDNMRTAAYVLVGVLIGAAVTYFAATPRQSWAYGPGMMGGYGYGPGMMWGQDYGQGWGMMQYMQGYRDTVAADCSTITSEELVEIGDDVMGQMIGDEAVHERIDATHPNIDSVHLAMGRMATGCY